MDDRLSGLIEQAKAVDLLELASRYTTLRRIASTGGGEFQGPCPVCGGSKRFHVQPDRAGGGRWFCRHCTGAEWQDVIAFQRFITGQSFPEGVRALAGQECRQYPRRREPDRELGASAMVAPPNDKWQARGLELVERARESLWEGRGSSVNVEWTERDADTGEPITRLLTPLDWLHSRGLSDKTLRIWNIGFVTTSWHEEAKDWGLDGKPVWTQNGILIPCIIGGKIWYLKVRRPGGNYKYCQVRGSRPALYMVQTLALKDTAVFCEGELDALLLQQEAEDLVGVVTLGSATTPLNVATWGLYLLGIKYFFLTYDIDPEGEKGADRLAWLGGAVRLDIPKVRPFDKDLTDFYKSNGDLWGWLQGKLKSVVM